MSKAIRASALILLLACSARAGIMQYGVAPPPPPPVQSTGIMQNGAAPLLVQIALNLLTLL